MNRRTLLLLAVLLAPGLASAQSGVRVRSVPETPLIEAARDGQRLNVDLVFENPGTTPLELAGLEATVFDAGGRLVTQRRVDTNGSDTTMSLLAIPHRMLPAGGRLTVRLAGSCGVPAAGVGAVQVHVTATGASRASHLTVHPSGVPAPKTSSVNYSVSRPVANSVTVKLGSDGAIAVTNGGGAVHVVVDLLGWFAATPAASANGLHAIVPVRKFDSRATGTRVGRLGTSVTVTGGTLKQNGAALKWHPQGYYEVALDAKSVTLSP